MEASKSRSTPETEAVVKKFKNDCSIREYCEKFLSALEAKEKHLEGIEESVTKSSKELDLRRQSAEEFLAQVMKKEEELKQMKLAEEKGLRDWELKKKEMDLMCEKLEGQQKVVNEELGKLEDFQKSLNERWKIKEKILAFRAEALDAKEKELVARERLLDLINTDGSDNTPNGVDSAPQARRITRSQSKKRRTMALDSVKDTHNTPSPSQQPPMLFPTPQATTGIPEQGQQARDAASTSTPPTSSSSVKDSRILIEPLGDSFNHHEECMRVIKDIFDRSISDNRLDPQHPLFREVPADVGNTLFTEFKQFFRWSREHHALIRANWNKELNHLFDGAVTRMRLQRQISFHYGRSRNSSQRKIHVSESDM